MGKRTPNKTTAQRTQKLKALAVAATFTLNDARKAGIPHATLLRMLKRGEVVRLERGLYSIPGKEPDGEFGDFELATRKFGKEVVIGGLTALFHYKLIDEVPTQIWLLVPPTIRSSDRRYRLLRTKRNLEVGIKSEDGYRIESIERALLDALIFVTKVGERVAKTAIVRALRNKQTTTTKLFKMAKELDIIPTLEREWQSILAGLAQ